MSIEGQELSLRQKAYVHIQQNLIEGRWGLNDRISEAAIAHELGMSRTPVRDAIRRMISEGLLYQVASSGTFVTKPDRQSIAEMFEVRLALEGMAAAKAAGLVRPAEIRELQRLLTVMQNCAREFRDSAATFLVGDCLDRFIKADRETHKILLGVADNRLAWNMVHNGRIQTLIYGLHSYQRDLAHISATLLSHARILRAIRKRDGAQARHWMEVHIRNSMLDALTAYDHQEREQNPGAVRAVEEARS